MKNLIILAIAVAAFGYIIFQILDFFFSVSSPKSRVKKDRKFGRVELKALTQNLVPLDHEEMMLLSFERDHKRKPKATYTAFFGTIHSIYHEPLVAYYMYEYSDGRLLLLTQFSETEVSFYFDGDQCLVTIDGKDSYSIQKNYDFLDISTQNRIAKLDVQKEAEAAIVLTNEKELAHINWKTEKTETGRIFSIYNAASDQEMIINYCYSIVNLFNIF